MDPESSPDDSGSIFVACAKQVSASIDVETDDDETYELSIPNREIRSVYRREILDNLSGYVGRSVLRDMMHAMLDGDASLFESYLAQILRGAVSVHDAAHPESFYHGMMLGMTIWLGQKFRIASNRESGYGRFDLAFFPKQDNLPGIIMEFKAVKTEDELPTAVDAACQRLAPPDRDRAIIIQVDIVEYAVILNHKMVILTIELYPGAILLTQRRLEFGVDLIYRHRTHKFKLHPADFCTLERNNLILKNINNQR